MKFSIDKNLLLATLQQVAGVVEKRHSQPILSHFLFQVQTHQMTVVGTDLEVELQARCTLGEPAEIGNVTLPGRKLIDICRAITENEQISLAHQDHQVLVQAGKSRFTLSSLEADTFPHMDVGPAELEFNIAKDQLRNLLESTYFAMAQQDVRYYLNGLCLRFSKQQITCVGTDGHRLSLCRADSEQTLQDYEVIIPRKAVIEIIRLLNECDENVQIAITAQHIKIDGKGFSLLSKRIDGRYPDFNAVMPKNCDKEVRIDRDLMKQALSRVSILSNEKYKGVRMQLRQNKLVLLAHNPEQEAAEEEITISYNGDALDIGFNVSYLLDVLNHIPEGDLSLQLADANSSMMTHSTSENSQAHFVIMPMRLS